MSDTTKYGAVPPPDAALQIGDRADKACVIAASLVLRQHGHGVDFIVVQKAIDAYLTRAAEYGWKFK